MVLLVVCAVVSRTPAMLQFIIKRKNTHWCIIPVPSTELLKHMEFSVMRAIKMSFKGYVDGDTFGK